MGRPPETSYKINKRLSRLEEQISRSCDFRLMAAQADALKGIEPYAKSRLRQLMKDYAETGDDNIQDELMKWSSVLSAIRLSDATPPTDTGSVT